MKKISVLIVDDSLLFRTAIANAFMNDTMIQIIGTAASANEAKDKIPVLKPDVLTLDIEMPGMSGLEFLKILMANNPMPVVMVSSLGGAVFEAMNSGAVDFVVKPAKGMGDMNDFFADLAQKIKAAANSSMVLNKKAEPNRLALSTPVMSAVSSAPLNDVSGIVAIGASTGGTEATSKLLKALPARMPGIVITQHMPPVFTKMYADRLDRECALTVKEAQSGDIVAPGKAFIAPGDKHMTIIRVNNEYVIKCLEGEKVSGHCPSVDVLFDSVAKCAGGHAVGVILTGMGMDGAKGLFAMRKAGAYTIGQDKESCVVYGMPMEANKIGAVIREANLTQIPSILIGAIKTLKK